MLMNALVLAAKMRPAPPVANSVALACSDHDLAGFHLQRGDAEHVAVDVADQVERHPFDEELGARPHVALVERVQHRVAGAIRGRARALYRFLAEIRRVSAERSLIDRTVGIAVERHAVVLEFVDDLGRHAAHVFDRVLVAEPVGTLDRVVHVPEPVVLAHVAERRADAALRRDGVRACRKHLREHRDREAGFGKLQRRAHAGTTGADDDRIELAHGQAHWGRPVELMQSVPRGSAAPTRRSRPARSR